MFLAKKSSKHKCVTVKVNERKAYSYTMLASFILFVKCNSIYENLMLEFTGIKVIYQARILKVILKVRKLGKIEWCHR